MVAMMTMTRVGGECRAVRMDGYRRVPCIEEMVGRPGRVRGWRGGAVEEVVSESIEMQWTTGTERFGKKQDSCRRGPGFISPLQGIAGDAARDPRRRYEVVLLPIEPHAYHYYIMADLSRGAMAKAGRNPWSREGSCLGVGAYTANFGPLPPAHQTTSLPNP